MKNKILSLMCILVLAISNANAVIAVTGSPADRADLAAILTASSGVAVTVDGAGNLVMPPALPGENGCAVAIRMLINDTTVITINIGRNMPNVIGGRFNPQANGVSTGTQDIDLNDIEKFGNNNQNGNFSRGSVLLHEFWEVNYSVKHNKDYATSHQHAITICENGYYTSMTAAPALPTQRVCGPESAYCDTVNPGHYIVYSKFTNGTTGVTGVSCIPVTISGTSIEITAAPTFTVTPNPPSTYSLVPGGLFSYVSQNGTLNTYNCSLIPTVSEWGLILLFLLIAAMTMRFIFQQQPNVVFSGIDYANTTQPKTVFKNKRYFMVLAYVLGISIAGMFLYAFFVSELNRTDTVGIICTDFIVAYMIYLYLNTKLRMEETID